jgi:ATP-dependent helicase/nuclease subunit A
LNYFYERNKEEDKKQAWAELKRLFYVAATRAERRLIIFGARKLNKKESGSLEGLSDQDRPAALLAVVRQDTDGEASTKTFLDLIALGLSTPQGKTAQYKLFPVPSLELLEKNRRYAELEQLFRQSNINGRDPKANPEALLEDFFALPPKAIPLEPSRLISPTRMESLRREEKKTKAEQLPTLDVDDLLGKHRMESAFGTLCHGNIERLLAGLPPNVPKEVEIAFRNSNMEQGDRTKLLRRALGLAEDFFKSPFGAQARSAPRRRAEFPFLLPLPDSGAKPMLVQGIIDLLYEFDGRCIILDFKTDRGFEPEAHQVQLDAYRLAAAAFSDLPVETWLVYLRGMRPVRLDQALGAQDIALLAEAALGEDERTRSLEMAT